jgi:protein O-mannosyl-transferase
MPPSPANSVAPQRPALLPGLGLFLAVFVLFAQTTLHPSLNYDDPDYVFQNPHVLSGLTAANVSWAFTTFHAANWHPLTWLSLQADASLFGVDSAFGFHLTNDLLHAANVVLLFCVLHALTGALWRSAAVAALFGLHPLRVESVAWVAERKDVLSTLFWLLTLWAYLAYVRRPGAGRYALVLLGLLLGLMAKPMLVTLPCVLLLLDYWPLGRLRLAGRKPAATSGPQPQRFRRLLLEKVPLFLLAAVSCGVTLLAQGAGYAIRTLEVVPFAARLANALVAYVVYLRTLAWPSDLAPHHPATRASLLDWQTAAAALLLAGLTALAIRERRRRPYLVVGWLWYLGTLVPVIGLVQVGAQSWADRYTYVPHIGLLLALVWGAADLLAAWKVPLVARGAVAAGVVLLCGLATCVQLGYWGDNVRLWEHTLAVTGPDDALAQQNLGIALANADRPQEALPHLRKGLELEPGNPAAAYHLGLVLGELGEHEEAVRILSAAVRLVPQDRRLQFGLARALVQSGQAEEAVGHFAAASLDEREDRRRFPARLLAGQALLEQHKYTAAREQFAEAVRLDPGSPEGLRWLGLSLVWEGRYEEAAHSLREAVRLNPSDAAAHSQLGLALLGQEQPAEALTCCEKAVALKPDSPWYHGNLALVLAELGREAEARLQYETAVRLDAAWPRAAARMAWAVATHPGVPPKAAEQAVLLARQACRATGERDPELLETLAAALAAAGQFPAAQQTAQGALEKATQAGLERVAARLRRELDLYRAGQPWRGQPG